MAPNEQGSSQYLLAGGAVTLNVLPDLSGGSPYQIRGKAYWIKSELATSSHLFVLRAVIGQDAEAAEQMQNQLV